MKYYKVFLAAIVLVTGTSCNKDFEQINTDPNRLDTISPGTLLNPVIYNMASYNMLRSNDITFDLMQVALPYPSASGGVHRYDLSDNIGNGTWNASYLWLNNIREMYGVSVKAQDVNYQAIAMTLNAWIYANITDLFGDVPMGEASRAEEGIIHPKFDTQKEIYTKLIADLDSANNLYNSSKTMIYGKEILFANDVNKWKKFCNSLQMRLLLRVSKKAEMNSMAKLRAMIDNPTKYPVFTANTDAAVLQLTGITPLPSPWGRAIDFTTFRAAGKFFIDTLNAYTGDPRLAKFTTQARSVPANAAIGYQGIPSGYPVTQQFNFTPSNLNQGLVIGPMICPIMFYSEVEFIKAEVELSFNNAAAAKVAYEKAVKAAIEQWGLVMPTTYFNDPDAAYNGTLARIQMQKYYGLFFCDFQQWFECRRTGYPVLQKADGLGNNKTLPARLQYPIPVRTTNAVNYAKVVLAIGGDDINTKVWWQQ